MSRRSVLSLVALSCALLAACSGASSEDGLSSAVRSERDAGSSPGRVDVKMRDGVHLRTWVYVPDGPGPFPFFMVRNPYASQNEEGALSAYARFFTARGIGLMWQATRGTGGSGGTFVPYVSEVDDAHDTIAWLLEQSYSNGRIGAGGGSYLGYTALAAAAASPHVVVVLADDTAADEEMTRHGGVVNGYLLSWWSYVERGRFASDRERKLLTNGLDPFAADVSVLGRDVPYWNAAINAPPPAVYPPRASLRSLASSICVPTLHIIEGETEWNDPRLAWDAIGVHGCARERDHQWLVVAPEGHSHHFNAFGAADTWVTPDMLTMLDAFLLKTAPAPTWPKVRYRVEAHEPTRFAASWPPKPVKTSTFFLDAPAAGEEGSLSSRAPTAATWMMVSDPEATDPCTTPTATWFTSPPLQTDLVLTGSPVLHLTASTDAADFDVHVQAYDYSAQPESYRPLGTGSMRARFRKGVEEPLPSSQSFELDVELTAMARRVPAGHQVTVSVAPSRCGFVENPNSADERRRIRRRAQISFATGDHGARLVLP